MAEPSLLLKDKQVEQGGRRKRTGKFSEYFPLGTVVHHQSRGFNIYDLQHEFYFPSVGILRCAIKCYCIHLERVGSLV